MPTRRLNALTVDVEDWHQLIARRLTGVLPAPDPVVVDNTRRMLDLFDQYSVRTTCFILGTIAEAFPALVQEIVQRGHALGSHGDQHWRVDQQTPEAFRQDIQQSLQRIRRLTDAPIRGYRAPEFSIIARSRWALDILHDHGFSYDSSIFPIAGRRYGIPGTPFFPHRMATSSGGTIAEFPLTVVALGRRVYPVAGGGYFRLLPYAATHAAIQHINAENRSAIVYLHPYEIERTMLYPTRIPKTSSGYMAALRWYISQNIGRQRVLIRLERLLQDFAFGALEDLPEYDSITCT